MRISLIFLFCLTLLAPAFSFSTEIQEIQTLTPDHVLLKGVRFPNEDGQRVLLMHGFAENTRVFRELAKTLQDLGYDVYLFNSRGHGNGEHRSVNPNIDPFHRADGFYGFDNVVVQDVPAMIDSVYNGKPIIAIGHSLGGAQLRYFLSGVREGAKGLYISRDQKKLKSYLQKVSQVISLGSPTSFQKKYATFQLWSNLPGYMTNLFLSPFTRDEAPTEEPGLLHKIKNAVVETVHDKFHKAVGGLVYDGLLNLENIEVEDEANSVGRLFLKAFSRIPTDLVEDVQRWTSQGFQSRTGLSYEGLAIPEELSYTQVAGSDDKLASPQEILGEHEDFRITHDPHVIVLKDFSHIDLASGFKSAQLVTELVMTLGKPKKLKQYLNSESIEVLFPEVTCRSLFSL